MSEKVQKFRALQSSFDATKKMVDIVIPQGIGKVDLSKSSLVVKVDVSAVSSDAGNQALAVPPNFDTLLRIKSTGVDETAFLSGISPHSMAALVKHAELRSAKLGVIESIRNVDLLRNSLASYKKSYVDVEREFSRSNNASLKSFYNNNGILDAVGRGQESSKERTKDLVIPLHELFEYCRNPAYDSNKNGDLTIHAEMRFDVIDAVSTRTSNRDFTIDGGAAAARANDPAAPNAGIKGDFARANGGTQVLGLDSNNTSHYKNIQINSVRADDAAAAGTTGGAQRRLGTVYRTDAQYADLRSCPWFVGQEVFVKTTTLLTAGGGAAAQVSAGAVIRRIERANAPSAGTGLTGAGANAPSPASDALDLTLEFNTAGGAGDAQGINMPINTTIQSIQIEVAGGAQNADTETNPTLTVAINDVEAVVTVDDGNSAPSPYSYISYSSEEDIYTPLANFRRNYDIPSNTRNIFVLFQPAATSSSISQSANLNSYRVTINNEDIFGREVNYRSALHHELVSQAFINSGDRIKSVDERAFNSVASLLGGKTFALNHGSDRGKELKMLCFPCPLSGDVQKLGLELNGFTDANPPVAADLTGRHVIYYERLMSK